MSFCISWLPLHFPLWQRHDGWVSDAALSRAGDKCVTVGGDGLVCVWDARNGDLQVR
jgi:WD40 repeat protein